MQAQRAKAPMKASSIGANASHTATKHKKSQSPSINLQKNPTEQNVIELELMTAA
jgi:hypothetical protein